MPAPRLTARIRLTDDAVVVDSQLEGHPPRHRECPWGTMEAFAVGRPDASYPEGIYLLLRQAPHGDYLWRLADGAQAVVAELRRRGVPERAAPELQAEVDSRQLADLEQEARGLFPEKDWPRVRALLDGSPELARPRLRRAVVRLSRGELARLEQLVRDARRDWRDVLYWAQREGLA